ncbi:AfsR/SARP family transcriptional regulator [Nesterenkonia muleiensis]|uniref:AfsR/SARP family transcriptional regulator n=1 Tax=Nesterenkonia muleiensis TaxID=2282648 RepID=UPI000E71D262|nr:BTAD domain-containing putative transcriptional regulator [Nesterenkonia muleiensis]
MRIEVLGPLRLRDDDGNTVEVPERKVRALLAALAAAGGQAVAAEKLVDQAWGESLPDHPVRVLQAKLSQLRALLDAASPGAREMLVRSPGGYSLPVTSKTLDAAEFRDTIRSASELPTDQERAAMLQDALKLWRGTPYAEFADELWLSAEVGGLQEIRLQAVERTAEALTAMGAPERAVACAAEHLAAHPTREALAAPLMLAHYRTRRQPEALAVYDRLRHHLAEELGTDPSHQLQQLYLQILRQDPALDPAPSAASSSQDQSPAQQAGLQRRRLPAYASDFLGRAEELGEIRRLMGAHRLVTLMGIGGIGKTRLAVKAAEQAAHDDAAEAWFVDLTELSAQDAEDAAGCQRRVARAVAAVLGLPTPRDENADLTERIAASLQSRGALLVLDNCEHVLDGVTPFTGRLLSSAESVRVLATSREPLALPEEQRYTVPQLPVNGEYLHSANELEQPSPAVEFFLTRARAVHPGLEADQSTIDAATELCRRLDGLPLALELAAARTSVLSVPELLERITDRLDLLARPDRAAPRRQQTLRGMLDWSWSLLGHQERILLRRLAVHPVSWRLEVIEEICAGSPSTRQEESEPREHCTDLPPYESSLPRSSVLPALSRLVDRSLISTVRTSRGLRYRMLETVHSYAAEKLAEAGEPPVVAARHLGYFRDMVECAEQYLFSRHAKGWVDWMDAERSHISYALAEALRRQDGRNAASLALSTFWFRWMTARFDSLAEELSAVAACPYSDQNPEDQNLHAQVLVLARTVQELHPQARAEQVLAALDTFTDDDAGRLARMQVQWFAATGLLTLESHRELGEHLADEAIEHLIAAGDLPGAAFASTQRDWFLLDHWGIRPRGLPAGYDAETILREHGDAYGMTQVLGVQYLVAETDGVTTRARAVTEEAVQLAEDLGLNGELAYWEIMRALNSLRGDDLGAAERHLHRAGELARRTANDFCLVHSDAVEAVLAQRQGDQARAERILAGLSAQDRDVAHRTLSRALGEEALPEDLQLTRT